MSSIDRVPPSNIEAEEALLGSLLIDTDAIFDVAAFLRPEAFYLEKNRWVYQAVLDLNEAHKPVDLITLSDELRRRQQLNELGGEAYLIGLINLVPTSVNARSYGRIVEAAALRLAVRPALGQGQRGKYQRQCKDDRSAYQNQTSVHNILPFTVESLFRMPI